MRKEIKYEFPLGIDKSIITFLRINLCKEIYENRTVNSIYYDNNQLDLFHETANGIGLRNKLRIRFYNKADKVYKIERKIKFYELNDKNFFNLEDLNKNNSFNSEDNLILNINNSNKILIPHFINGSYIPTVFVNYNRRYFLTPCSKGRLTIDTNINFSKVSINKKVINLLPNRFLGHDILEIKFEFDSHSISNLISKIVNEFNLTYTKCSKYSKAIESTF